ncbi:amidase [Rhodoblastus acidophilus]|uniref:amidase family protein n=1 Tax=Rhodoblastus acidophilus TaxID=1074 RepID=UPI0022257894|nr:amidase family protein [Rhodoblastus acidophilus]MCW2317545.1 amidase [Rhodoblastus acidophilus]
MADLTGFDEAFFTAPAEAWRDALRKRDFSARELFEAVWARVMERNPAVNALIAWDEDGARRAADEADKRLARRERLPLDGLPLSIKDSFATAGLTTTCGAEELADYVPEEDALAVARLRAAGAVIFAKSNVPRLTGDFQTYNGLFGATCNPWDLSRSPGGSSGGAAASVAAGLTAFELGSDLGGSIRWPAHGCGLFGLKTSWSQVPMLGHIPPLPSIKLKNPPDLGVAGPLARSAGDLELALSVVAGPVNASGPAFLPKPRRQSAKDWRVALWLDPNFAPVDPEVEQGVLLAADLLRETGARVEPARPDFTLEEALDIYALLNFAIGFAGAPPEVRARAAQEGEGFWPALRARAARMDAAAYAGLMTRRAVMKRAFAEFFGRYDAILCPLAPCLAIEHDLSPDAFARRLPLRGGDLPYHDLLKWACVAALAHLPAAAVPVAPGPSGLPRGAQLICAYDEDRSAIALARLLEEAGGGFRAPPFPFGTGAAGPA